MSPLALKAIREEVKKYIDHADEKVVRMVHAMLEVAEEDDEAYYAELDRRTQQFESGQVKGYTLSEVEEEAIAYAKEKLKKK